MILDAGPLQITLHVSRTAHLFHVVDQLAAWSEFCHTQYREGMDPLTPSDLAVLARHVAVRAERPWGQGLEQTFYTTLPVEEAFKRGIRENWLTQEQGDTEREVFKHFADRIDTLLKNERVHLLRFQERLLAQQPQLHSLSVQLSRFCFGAAPHIPAYLIANPHDRNHGGGFNGGVLVIEVPRVRDAYPVFVHEAMHAFLKSQHNRLETAVAGVEGLNGQTLSEGIAHALAPGLLHAEGSDADPLYQRVVKDLEHGRTLAQSSTRYYRYALVLRPLLREALQDTSQTVETFLPRAVDAWRVLLALDKLYTQAVPAPSTR